MTKKKNDEKPEVEEVDSAWLMTKTLGIGLAEARARLAAEADPVEPTEPTTPAE